MSFYHSLHRWLWDLRRKLQLSPTQQVFKELQRRGVRLQDLVALEAFGGDGSLHTKDYASQISSLDVWEINPRAEAALRKNLPMAGVKITDTYQELQRTTKKYNLIVLDAPESLGEGGSQREHFDIMDSALRLAMDDTVMILNVQPGYAGPRKRSLPLDALHLQKRREFYRTDRPEAITPAQVDETYRRVVAQHGFDLDWWFMRRRTLDGRLYYLALKLTRRSS